MDINRTLGHSGIIAAVAVDDLIACKNPTRSLGEPKFLSKMTFIFVSNILNTLVDIANQMTPARVCP